MITVAIVDNDPLARTVLADLVRSRPNEFSMTVAVPSVDELLAAGSIQTLDVVVLDARLGPGNHLAGNIEVITALGPRILVVTCEPDRSEIVPALRHRPVSILDKDNLEDGLHDALRLTAAGTIVVAPSIQARLHAQASPVPDLTPRQQEVFKLLASGLPIKSIARKLEIGYKTVYDHVDEIRRRFRDAGQPIDDDLTAHYTAIELGYIPDPRNGG